MQVEEFVAMVFIFGMFGGVFIVYLGLRQRSQQLQDAASRANGDD